MFVFEPADQSEQLPLRLDRVAAAPGGRQLRAGPRPLRFGQVLGDVVCLVNLTALDQRPLAKNVAHRLGQSLRSVDDHQRRTIGSQPASHQICEQLPDGDRVLGRALPQTQDVLSALTINAQLDEHHVVGHLSRHGLRRSSAPPVRTARQERAQGVGGLSHEPSADGAPASAARRHARGAPAPTSGRTCASPRPRPWSDPDGLRRQSPNPQSALPPDTWHQ